MYAPLLLYAVAAITLLALVRLVYRAFTSPLRYVPGPLAARFTKLWYLGRVCYGHFEADNIALHRKYGKVVRIAPDWYSIDDPTAIKQIYGVASKFPKNDWYYGWQHPDQNNYSLFSDRDTKRHAETRRRFQSLYSMSSLVNYEPFVDQCADLIQQRMEEFAAGKDIDGAIGQLWNVMIYSTVIGIFSQFHARLFPWTSKLSWTGANGRLYVMNFVRHQINKRKEERKRRDSNKGQASALQRDHGEQTPEDFLEKMMNRHEEDPEKVTPYHVYMVGQSNIIAGSDTTAISLSAVLYYLLRYPRTMQKLKAEIKEFEERGVCTDQVVSFKESLALPYLQAVMKEALRMHPATGLPLWRVVPEGGARIAGHFFPAGTTVGINTWVAHRNHDVWGPDADTFRPERWTEADAEQLKKLDYHFMPFGAGSRTCIGRHISELEMSKLIPRIVRDFDFTLEKSAKEWSTENFWFVKPTDFRVTVRVAKKD